jgi:hypothetical protein
VTVTAIEVPVTLTECAVPPQMTGTRSVTGVALVGPAGTTMTPTASAAGAHQERGEKEETACETHEMLL